MVQALRTTRRTTVAVGIVAAQNDIVVNVIEVPEAGYADHLQLADSALHSSTGPLALFAEQLIAAKKIDIDSTANHGYEAIQ
jgi:hypothetical protein